jgi:hypothetical protein
MSDDATMTPIQHAREIAKTVGLLHSETIKLRRAGLPAKFLGGLDAIDQILTTLADQNAALGEAVRAPEPDADAEKLPADAEKLPADASAMGGKKGAVTGAPVAGTLHAPPPAPPPGNYRGVNRSAGGRGEGRRRLLHD